MPNDPLNQIRFDGQTYALDTHGYLDPPDQWDKAFARGMAKNLGILDGLSDKHWQLIDYLRKKFVEENTVPFVITACVDNKLKLSHLRSLFPTGYHRGACRIAGINYAFIAQTNILLTYESYTTSRTKHHCTETGFLDNFEHWDKQFARLVMQEYGIEGTMSEMHWAILAYLRDYYRITRTIPTVFEMCKVHGIDIEELKRLFPGGYRRCACRAAGLPFFG